MSSNSTEPKQIRKFGLLAFLLFGSLCALGVWRERPIPIILFGFLSILGLGFISAPSYLRPVYGVWIRAAHFLGKMVNLLVLALAYYLVITPSALVKRLFGGRPIPLKPDKKAVSYWVAREEPLQPEERFLKRY